ncbi:MAG: DUF4118 domain-containing protein [Planctomycetota bacterium]|nr:DUF4118 domain-containing protein [Planctomycetota bacterium]
MRQIPKRYWSDYGFALFCVAVALATIWLYPPLIDRGMFGLLIAAVSLAAWRGGFGPAMVALVACVLLTMWMLPPADSLRVSNPQDVGRLIVFIFVSLLISSLHSARARAERLKEQTEQRLSFALESSGVACWDVDLRSGTFWKSPNLAEIYGRAPSDFANTYEGFFAYIQPEDRDFFRLASIRAGEKQRDYDISHRVICADGSTRLVTTRGRMYLDDSGQVIRMVGTVHERDQSRVIGGGEPRQDNGTLLSSAN